MARTALVDLLRRAAAISAIARQSGESLDEAIARDIELRTNASRRRFLRQSVAASAALMVAACAPTRMIAGSGGDDEVVVVGAGVAGLTCAWRLRQAGVKVRLYEAQERVGGRMFSLRNHFADGQVCELGGELIDTGHARIRALAAEFGLVLDDLSEDPTHAYGDIWFADGRRYSEAEILRAFAPLAEAIRRDADSLPDEEITYATPGGCEALDRESMTQWLDRNGASGWLRRLIEVAYTTEMGLECEEQSALNFLTFIDPGTEAFRIFGESDERFHVRGGNDSIVRALGAKLDDAIQTGCVLEAMRQSADGRYTLSFKRGDGAFDATASRVVLALPFTTLRRVRIDVDLPVAKCRAIDELGYGTNAKLMIGFSERVWRTRHASGGATYSDLPYQTTWETSRMQAGNAGILTNFVGGVHGVEIGQGTPKQQADRTAVELDAVFPGISAARAGMREARMHWPTFPWTLGSYACFRPGQWTTIRGAIGEPVGNLHFAGEHCAFDNQGFMEGGVETGEWVAQALLGRHANQAA
ncbi:flavin monoamine oxidase family protein [Dokdonella immobilis]|uniref:Monoamine oxidase n=1 Tax=Dokdonella immobilis TaxID=578942 RepID=A0A1I4Y2R7_9GAMM|nr:NAD(P)/FAD-dependent oxidoreductase [Dokdonella immobilis]SFN32384.1 monoamine oxidase [Dokdonella immobilis]